MSNMPFSSTLRTLGLLALLSVHVGVEASQPNVQSFKDAIRGGQLQELKNLLINADQNTLKKFLNEHSLLHMACKRDNLDIVKALVGAGAGVDVPDKTHDTPLCIASRNGYYTTVEWLWQRGASISMQGRDKKTPLHAALATTIKEGKQERIKIAKLLIEKGADLNIVDKEQDTPLHMALDREFPGIAELLAKKLIQSGGNLNKQNGSGETPLYIASDQGYTTVVTLLINNNAKLDIPNQFQTTPLHIALWKGHSKIATLLINNNAKLDIQGRYGNTPLHIALEKGRDEIATLLVNKSVASKANLNIQNDDKKTPLHRALEKGKDEIATLLISSNAKLDIQGRYGNTPLHIALEKGKDKIATLLVNKLVASKANLNIQEEYGMTPLHLAVEKKNYAVAALLVQGGANPDIQSKHNGTPRDIALFDEKMEAILNTKKNKGSSNANNQESLLNGDVSVDDILKNSPFKDGKQSSQGSFSKNDYNDLNYLTDKNQISTQGSNQGGLQPSNTGNIKSMFANNSTQKMPPKNVLNQNNVLQGDLNKKKPINNLLNQDPTKSNLPQKALFALLVLVALGAICYFVAPKEENPKQHRRRASQEARYQAAQQPLPYQAVTTQPWAYPIAQPA